MTDRMTRMTDRAHIQAYVDGNAALHSALGIAVGTPLPLCDLAQGEYNLNFRFEHPTQGNSLVLRVNLGSQLHLEQQIDYEASALELLAACPRTPQVHYVDGSKQLIAHGVLVMDYLEGRPLCYQTDLDEAARILADIHATPVPAACPLLAPSNPLVAIVDESRDLLAVYRASAFCDALTLAELDYCMAFSQASLAQGTGAAARAERHIVNTELNSANFIIPAGAPGYLVDWEKPLLSDVAQDLSHFLIPTTTNWRTDTILTEAQIAAFLAAYETAVDGRFDTSGVRERFDSYATITSLRALSWCAMAYTEYAAGDRALTNQETYEKIQAFLAPSFLAYIRSRFFK
jgi:aminoglycoside phosphotransferase (APT) family kinase protein